MVFHPTYKRILEFERLNVRNKNGMFIIVTFEIRKWKHFFILMCCNHFRSLVNAIQSEIMSSSDEDSFYITGKAFELHKEEEIHQN